MKRIKLPLVSAIAIALLAGSSIGVVAQEPIGPGYTFTRTTFSENDLFSLDGIAELATGEMVVVGDRGGERPASFAWASADGGETWDRSRFKGDGTDVRAGIVARDDGFVTVVNTSTGQGNRVRHSARVWTSPDGVAWEPEGKLPNATISQILTTSDGLVLNGLEHRTAPGFGKRFAGYPSVWVSDDGSTWDVHEITTPLYFKDMSPLAAHVARSDDGTWLAAGTRKKNETEERMGLWRSTDGVDWVATDPPLGPEDANSTAVELLWTQAGFVLSAGADADGRPRSGIWLSPDGLTWESVADFWPALAVDVFATDGTKVIGLGPAVDFFGEEEPSLLEEAPLYLSPDGRTWEMPASSGLPLFVTSATLTLDGRLLVTGKDTTGCKEVHCLFMTGAGAIPAVWIGEPLP